MHSIMYSFVALIFYAAFSLCNSEFCTKGTSFTQHDETYLEAYDTSTVSAVSILQCSQSCFGSKRFCSGVNFKKTKEADGKHICILIFDDSNDIADLSVTSENWIFLENKLPTRVGGHCRTVFQSCKEIKQNLPSSGNGVYWLKVNDQEFKAYCDMQHDGYTLIARFSNYDAKNWMGVTGSWWYDLISSGSDSTAAENADMLSPAFSLVKGTDIKVTRSDDVNHNALLNAADCISNNTMRHKITSYGNFRNGVQWMQDNKCYGSCTATFAVNSKETEAFKFVDTACNHGNDILSKGNIGFWCKYDLGDGAVIMIGGGGVSCSRADHGLGITEKNIPAFGYTPYGFHDFGNDARDGPPTNQYALNLWLH